MSAISSTSLSKLTLSLEKKSATRGARRRSRECVVQGLYTWLINYEPDGMVSNNAANIIESFLRGGQDFVHCDAELFQSLLHGALEHAVQTRGIFAQHIDRQPADLSPVEHALLLLGTYELLFCLDTPLRVIINEAVEISKSFGGNDAYKYINGVLDKVASKTRPVEFAASKQ
jgi:transcription antitermination protein NusB